MPKKLARNEIAPVRDAIVETFIQAQQFNDALARIIDQLRVEDDAWVDDAWLRLRPGKYKDSAYTLVSTWNARGLMADLISGLRRYAPHSDALRQVARARLASASAAIETVELQGFVQGGINYLPAGTWIDTLRRRMAAVCRIEFAGREPPGVGTGFLVSRDRVLTAHHVVELAIKHEMLAETIICRFGYLDDAVDRQGTRFPLSRPQWIAVERPPGAVELAAGGAEPTPEQSDFALLRLKGRIDDTEPLKPAQTAAKADHPVIVLQHPRSAALRIALGRVTGFNANGTRIRHSAATERGASGAPCLNLDLDVVGLHNAARYSGASTLADYNTAVPVTLIAPVITGQWTPAAPVPSGSL